MLTVFGKVEKVSIAIPNNLIRTITEFTSVEGIIVGSG